MDNVRGSSGRVSRHPFLLYPHFIDHWKKRLNRDEENFLDDDDFEAMFTDEDDGDMEETMTKKKKKQKKTTTVATKESKKSFSGFLIDNVGDEDDDAESSDQHHRKSKKRTTSNASSVTTAESPSLPTDDDDDVDDEVVEDDASSGSKHGDNDPVEIVKNYRTRSRTAATKEQKNGKASKGSNGKWADSDVFDSGHVKPTVAESTDDEDDDQAENDEEPWMKDMREQFWFPFLDMLPDESEFDISLSGKFLLLKSILDKCAEIGDKILLFSRSLYTLNYIERFLAYLHAQNERDYQQQCESRRQLRQLLESNGNSHPLYEYISPPVQWTRDEDYFRMDGQTDVIARKRYAKAFNEESNLRARLFLISTLAGGIGINLVGSNRVIVFDASWNPR